MQIYNCQLERMNLRPEAISFVKATHSYGYTYTLKWDKAADAEVKKYFSTTAYCQLYQVYKIYTRKNKGKWTARVTVDHAVDVTDIDEVMTSCHCSMFLTFWSLKVVLFSANHFGFSQQYRMSYDDDTWFTVDYWWVSSKWSSLLGHRSQTHYPAKADLIPGRIPVSYKQNHMILSRSLVYPALIVPPDAFGNSGKMTLNIFWLQITANFRKG